VATITLSGTVTHLEIEGGVWVIHSKDTNYNPTNLPDRFREEGLAVEVEARRRDDMVSISMVGPMIELLRIRAARSAPEPSLTDTTWDLIHLPGHTLPGMGRPTLAFAAGGTVAGFAGCNRFSGTAAIDGDRISLGPLAATRMFCPEPAMAIESAYLDALQRVARFELISGELHLVGREGGAPLRLRPAADHVGKRESP
jgi:heat shock protein HslJ